MQARQLAPMIQEKQLAVAKQLEEERQAGLQKINEAESENPGITAGTRAVSNFGFDGIVDSIEESGKMERDKIVATIGKRIEKLAADSVNTGVTSAVDNYMKLLRDDFSDLSGSQAWQLVPPDFQAEYHREKAAALKKSADKMPDAVTTYVPYGDLAMGGANFYTYERGGAPGFGGAGFGRDYSAPNETKKKLMQQAAEHASESTRITNAVNRKLGANVSMADVLKNAKPKKGKDGK